MGVLLSETGLENYPKYNSSPPFIATPRSRILSFRHFSNHPVYSLFPPPSNLDLRVTLFYICDWPLTLNSFFYIYVVRLLLCCEKRYSIFFICFNVFKVFIKVKNWISVVVTRDSWPITLDPLPLTRYPWPSTHDPLPLTRYPWPLTCVLDLPVQLQWFLAFCICCTSSILITPGAFMPLVLRHAQWPPILISWTNSNVAGVTNVKDI